MRIIGIVLLGLGIMGVKWLLGRLGVSIYR